MVRNLSRHNIDLSFKFDLRKIQIAMAKSSRGRAGFGRA